jgi:RHS repeat-associated protein
MTCEGTRFTGQERDSETQLDFFHARYFTAAQGRFTSPDPMNAGADPLSPQSWNAYGYVNNNPLSAIDALGLAPQSVGGGCTWDPDTNTLFCGGTGVNGCVSQGTQGCIRPPCVTLGSNCGESGYSGPPNGGDGGGGVTGDDGTLPNNDPNSVPDVPNPINVVSSYRQQAWQYVKAVAVNALCPSAGPQKVVLTSLRNGIIKGAVSGAVKGAATGAAAGSPFDGISAAPGAALGAATGATTAVVNATARIKACEVMGVPGY